MREIAVELIPWICSAVSLAGVWAYGNRGSGLGPWLGIIAIIPWMAFAILTESWGLIPANVVFCLMHWRNLKKMKREK